ncbi:2-octaprenyl-3-methyl-6-methoxy-1,4-benzoquinol hydroxylase [Exilibacterium tricleocarpae]|uniref:2-octaprenyl-3-methyl-6-methoxy-1,4-benzoquinol hydroxylase n=1 Tax=Exilibacterium tricleocarpae TaxID=2591008 RepID=A0A545SXM1_9GAMM|nr:FAD-dependent monooxygenase [Exilibacterium tricleocarpae]TQV69701.1 2-octaprenyl-3-methyl-6-methoxy-1,4-benzoquinol hydroxylase [Exilibacterium tricleocarpae]
MAVTEHQFDILIAGAGLVGASLACALAGHPATAHLRIGIVEAGGAPDVFAGDDFDPRVVALTCASQRYLQRLGAWELVTGARLCPYTDMHVWDAEGTGAIHFDAREVQQDCLGHIVENSVVLAALWQRLEALPGVELLHPEKVSGVERRAPDTVAVSLESGRALAAALLVAADGANSQIRQFVGFKTREWNYGHKAIVTTVKTERSHQFTAWQRFLDTGPLAFLPLQTAAGDDHYCSIVWSAQQALADDLMELDSDAFNGRLAQAFEYRLGAVTDSAERFCIPLRQRHAVDYVQPTIALVGDAAHTIHPLAGQGVNLGLLDAAVLGEEVVRAVQRQVPLADFSVLRRYQRRRQSHNLGMMAVMEGFKRLFGTRALPIRWLRNRGMSRLDSLPVLKNAVVKQAMGL